MMLLRLGLRNLWLHKAKTLIVGSILAVGTMLIIVGSGLLSAVDQGMEASLVNSVSAHIQLYSKDSKDEFQLFGNFDGSMADVGQIHDFSRVREVLLGLDNVRTVVPMGINYAATTTTSILERKLADLRETVRHNDPARRSVIIRHVRRIIEVLSSDLANAERLLDLQRMRDAYGDHEATLGKAKSDAFWQKFEKEPLDALEFLDNDVGPLALGEDMIFVRYIGTDTALFQQTFDRFEIVDGEMIPPGKRGFLFNKRVYEEMLKNKTARRLDKIKEKLDEGRRIARCEDCRTWIDRNISQASSLVYQMDDVAAQKVLERLQGYLKSRKPDLTALLKEFLQTNDDNFRERYELFYEVVAPHIVLYTVALGDEFVLTGFAQSGGYARRVPVKVYGTFRFRSLDRSPLAGGFSLMDIVSFRDLYGYLTEERKREQQNIRGSASIKDVKREDADAMFDDGAELVQQGDSVAFEATNEVDLKTGGRRFTDEVHQRVYSKQDLWNGVVLNVAVMLKDGSKLSETLSQIRQRIDKHELGLEAVDWRKASGMVGQLVMVIQAVLYGAVFIIFVVAIIIINNSLLMTTLERLREIGTMRAIGAQRGFVIRMFLMETGVLALLFGGLGAALGSGVMLVLEAVGIPAFSDFFYFLFAGPRLHPQLHLVHVVVALVLIGFVAAISTLYPAWIAARITPREAMATED